MEKSSSFEFEAMLKKRRNRPLLSVADVVQRSLASNLKKRKSSRISAFDLTRNLEKSESPAPKIEHRRQQLEVWKREKEKIKKDQAAKKKKPFLTGIARAPLRFVPPPPPPKPSTSGIVTRSQTKNATHFNPKSVKPIPKGSNNESFAPKNKRFYAPEIKNLNTLPTLSKPSKTEIKKKITFEPVLPKTATETEPSSFKKPLQSSSSGSDMDTAISKMRNLSSKTLKVPKPTTKLFIKESTSSSDSSIDLSRRKSSRKSIYPIRDSQSSSDKKQSSKEEPTVITTHRKSLPRNCAQPLKATSSSDRTSSAYDVEFIKEISPAFTLPATPKIRIPKSESSSEEKLRSPKSPINLVLTPEQMESAKISPYVTMSRGKENARKETMWKMDEGLFDEDVSYFRKQLSCEITRMTEMCETWQKISEQTVLPEPVQGAVRSAVCQCRLLMNKKLQQFASLVELCARPEPGADVVTPADLHGFWDMVYMQIENVDINFKKLEELRQRNWVEEEPLPAQRAVAARPLAKRPAKPPAANSRIREMIAAARKAKRDQTQALAPPTEGERTFDAGFFKVRSPGRAEPCTRPEPCTTATPQSNLRKAVLSSEAKKASRNASFAMLRASITAKEAEWEGVAPLPQTPVKEPVIFATPGKSILKSANATPSKSGKKSLKIVFINACDDDEPNQSPVLEDCTNVTAPGELNVPVLKLGTDKENTDTDNPEIRTPRTRSQYKKSQLNISNVDDSATKSQDTQIRKKSPRLLAFIKANEVPPLSLTPKASTRRPKK